VADYAGDDLKSVSYNLEIVGGRVGICTAAKAISATRRTIDTRREMTGMVKSCQAKRAMKILGSVDVI
jgi:hypothetical protein